MAEQNTLEGFKAAALRVGATGAVRVAKLGTELPSDLTVKYDTDKFRNVGYVGPDGLEVSFDDDTQEFIPWQELSSIRDDITKSVKQIKMTLWEYSKKNVAMFLGVKPEDIKESPGGGSWYVDEGGVPEFTHFLLSADVIDGTKAMRLIAPQAKVVSRESILAKRGEAMGLGLTISFYPADEDLYPDFHGKTCRWVFSNDWDGRGASTSEVEREMVISTSSLEDAKVGSEYSRKLTAGGGSAPYQWSVDAGTLPAGLDLSTGGTITGTPSEAGSKTFTVKATDSAGKSATKEFTIVVKS